MTRFIGGSSSRSRRVAGEGEEHVVERRLMDLDVVDRDPGVVQRAHNRGRQADSRAHRRAQAASVVADVHRTGDEGRSASPRRRSASLSVTSRRAPPVCAFSSAAVPPAITRPWSMTTIRSASSSASSRYCVVSSSVTPSATSSRITSHIRTLLVGSSPVVGSSRNSTGGRVRARPRDPGAGASRRSTPSGFDRRHR